MFPYGYVGLSLLFVVLFSRWLEIRSDMLVLLGGRFFAVLYAIMLSCGHLGLCLLLSVVVCCGI